MSNKKILLAVIFLLGLFLRLYKLDHIPPGVIDDEASAAYDSWLISQSGRDQWGKVLPLQFRSFGDYRLPVTEYILAPVVFLFGLKTFFVRLPFAFLGSLMILIFYFLIKEILKNKIFGEKIALLASCFLAVNPWAIGLSRRVYEANLATALFLLFFYYFLRAKNNNFFYWPSSIFFVLTFYTYYGIRILLLIFLIFLILWQKWNLRKVFKLKIQMTIIFLLLIPGIIFIFTGGGSARFRQVNLTKDVGIITRLNEHLGDCREYFYPLLCKFFLNKPTFFLISFIRNYFSHFSFNFIFSDFPFLAKSILPQSLFYLWMFPLFFIGLYSLKEKRNWLIMTFLLLAPIADSLTGSGNEIRSFIMIFPIIYFVSFGAFYLLQFMARKKTVFIFSLIAFIFIISFSLINFYINYISFFPKRHSYYTHWEYQPLFEYLKKVEKNYDNIYISKVNHDQRQYIFYLYYFKIPAEDYFHLKREYVVSNDSWVWVKKIGKFNFINQTDRLANYPPKSLLVIDPGGTRNLKHFCRSIKQIKYLNGDTAFNIYDLDKLKNLLKK